MNEKVYMHSIKHYKMNDQINAFISIFNDGYVLSKRNQGKTFSDNFSGLDYISLCDYEKRNMYPQDNKYYNSYYSYIRHGISLAFPKDKIDIIKPNYYSLEYNFDSPDVYMKIFGDNKDRYSDFIDEVQVKDKLNLDNLEYITFPTKTYLEKIYYYSKNKKYDLLLEKINEIKDILNQYKYDISVYDIDTKTNMNENSIKKLVYKK